MHDIATENWYYTQVFGDSKHYYTITFAKNTEEAHELINKWLDHHGVTGRRSINIYHKNYKRGARKAVSMGQFIDSKTLDTRTDYIQS